MLQEQKNTISTCFEACDKETITKIELKEKINEQIKLAEADVKNELFDFVHFLIASYKLKHTLSDVCVEFVR